MSRGINREIFTEVGLLLDTPEYGLVIKLTFGKALRKVLKHLFDKKLEVTVTELVYNRSAAQNRWLWGVAYETIIAWHRDNTGEKITKYAVHTQTLVEVMGYEPKFVFINGREYLDMEAPSTASLSTKQFNEMKEKLQAYWSERGCVIPDPKDKGNNYLSDYIDDK